MHSERATSSGWPQDASSSPEDELLSQQTATTAGTLLLELRGRPSDLDPRERGAAADAAAHRHIVAALAAARPDDAVLSEEGADDPARLQAERVWIVDPLDGTREFSEDGRSDWAVHVALSVSGRLVCGAVALPGLGRTLASGEGEPLPHRSGRPLRIVVSRSRAPAIASQVAEDLAAELAPLGSAGAKTAAVILGDADAYLHAGGQWEWDVAAPAAVASAHGLHVSRLDGTPLKFNQPKPWSPDLLVCRPEISDRLLEALAKRAPDAGAAWS